MRTIATLAVAAATACGGPPPLPSLDGLDLSADVKASAETAAAMAAEIPDSAALSGRVGMVLQANGRPEASLAWYSRARKLDPGDFAWPYYQAAAELAAGKAGAAAESLAAAVALEEHEPGMLAHAKLLLEAGKTEEACPVFEKLKDRRGSAAPAWYGVGRCRAASGDSKGAIEAYGFAIERYPRFGPAWQAMADEMRTTGQTEEADRAAARAHAVQGEEPPVLDSRMDALAALIVSAEGMQAHAQTMANQGRYREAVEALEKAGALDPRSPKPWVSLIVLHAQAGQAAEAQKAYLKAVEIDPGSAEAHFNYGVLAMQLENVDEAKQAFEKAIEADPEDVQSRVNYALTLEAGGDQTAARKQLAQALESDPAHRDGNFHSGRLAMEAGRFADAEKHLEKTVEPIDAQTPHYLYALAMAQAQNGDVPKAKATLERSRAIAQQQGQDQLVQEIDARLAGR